MAWVLFDKFMEKQHDGNAINLDIGGDTLKCMLITDVRAPVQATDEAMTDIDDNEVSGSNYTPGGATLANQVISLVAGTLKFDVDDITWLQHVTGFTNARYAVKYKSTGTPANDIPICYADLGGNKGNVSGDLALEMAAAGVFTQTNS